MDDDKRDRCCVGEQFKANTDSGFVIIGFNGLRSNRPPESLRDLVNPRLGKDLPQTVATWGFVTSNILHVDEGLRLVKAMRDREAGDSKYEKYFLYDREGPTKYSLHRLGFVEGPWS